jgi:hypothetical protein
MYDAEEFWWNVTDGSVIDKSEKSRVAAAISSRDGGILACNVMHLAAFKHLKELWLQKRQNGVPW